MNKLFLIFSILLLVLSSCSSSYNNMVVDDRVKVYNKNLKDFKKKEKGYLTTLFNLERYPDEKYLIKQKKILRQELDMQRQMVIQSRTELDKAISDWEHSLVIEKKENQNLQDVMKKVKNGRINDRPEWKGFK